jgi:hypothetical protein
MKTREQLDAANRHASYMRGWVDGAKVTTMRAEFDNHADEDLRAAYHRGYARGQGARSIASRDATVLYGHEPQILRLQVSTANALVMPPGCADE